MSKIAIRADGGKEIGMGHIMRTLVLAKELSKTNEVFYVCKSGENDSDKYIDGINKVKYEGFEVILVDEKNIINELRKIEADCLITDSYDVNEEYFNKTKKIFSKTGYIDDMNLYYFNVDFIINQNICAKKYKYKCNNETELFLGTEYIMLREEFRSEKPIKIKKNIENIMITMGGGDPYDCTGILIEYIKELKYNFNIIIGQAFKNNDIESKCKKLNNIKLHYNANMIEIMKNSDLAIAACGSTLYELAVLGVPTIGIIVADNQENIARKMKEEKIINNLGWYYDITKENLIETITNMDLNICKRVEVNTKAKLSTNKSGVLKLADNINSILNRKDYI